MLSQTRKASDWPPAASPAAPLRSRFVLCALIFLVLGGAALRIHFFSHDLARSPDERVYARQANMVLANGTLPGLRSLAEELAADPVNVGKYPSPLRAGFILTDASWMQLTGDNTPAGAAQLSLLCSMLALALLAACAYRWLPPFAALAATLLYAVFPLELTIARRAWQDALISLVGLALLALAIALARASQRMRAPLLAFFTLLGAYAFTVKENLGLAFLLCGAGLAVHLFARGRRTAALLVCASTAAGAALAVVLLSWIYGGLGVFLQLEHTMLHHSAGTAYDLEFNMGPAWMFPAALLRVAPVAMLAALLGGMAALYRPLRARSLARADVWAGMVLLAAGTMLIQVATARYDLRYTAPVYGALLLLAGDGVARITPGLYRRLLPLGAVAAWAILGSALAVAALRDLNFARDKLLNTGMQDLALRPVLGVAPLPPPQASQP